MWVWVPRRTRRVVVPLAATLAWLLMGVLTAHANRFGPPWQSRVIVDQTTLYSQADKTSTPVGPLTRGALVVVVNEVTGADGNPWTQVPDGYVVSSDIAEDDSPWIAEVS